MQSWDSNRDHVLESIYADAKASDVARVNHIKRGFRLYESGFQRQIDQPAFNHRKGKYERDHAITLNKYRDTIDYNRSSLIGSGNFESLISIENEAINKALMNLGILRNFTSLINRLVNSGSIAGDWYVLLSQEAGGPRATLQDPLNMTIIHDPDDFEKHIGYKIEWVSADGKVKRKIISLQEGQWVIQDWISTDKRSEDWEKVGPPIVWGYDFCPIVHGTNVESDHSTYGNPDISSQDIVTMDRINMVISQMVKTWCGNSDPVRVIEGAFANGKKGLRRAIKSGPQSEEGMSQEDANKITVMPGDIVPITPGSKLQFMTAFGDTDGGLRILQKLEEELADTLNKPLINPDTIKGQLSGVALEMLYGDHKKFIEHKRNNYGRGLIILFKSIVEMMGYSIDYTDVSINWPPVVPINKAEEVDIVLKKKDLGFSEKTLIEELGGVYEDEVRNRTQEADSLEALAMDALNSFEAGNI